MGDKFSEFAKSTTDFLYRNKNINQFLFIKLLSPLRKDLDYEFLNKIYFVKNKYIFIRNNILYLLKNYLFLIKSFLDISKIIFIKFRLVKSIVKASPNEKCEVAFVSHCDIKKQIENNIDSYYGINKNNLNYLFIFLNKTNIEAEELLKIIKKIKIKNSYFLNTSGSLEILFSCYLTAFKTHIILLFKFLKNPKNKLLLISACDSISKSSVTNLIIYRNLKKIIKNSNLNKIIITWEGHPWERYLANYCSKNNISLFGFVHAGPFKSQFSAYRFIGSNYEPKKLLSPTKITQKLLLSFFDKNSYVIGSNKNNLMKTNKKYINYNQTKIINKTLLLIPQGTPRDVKRLFYLSKNLLTDEITVRIRLHPALQKNKGLIDFLNSKIKNKNFTKSFIFSTKTIEQDIHLSTHFLYTCSTAALECLSAGLTPIHYNQEGEINSLEGYDIPNKFEAYSIQDIKKIMNYKIPRSYIDKMISLHNKSFDIDFIKNTNDI